MLETTRTGWQRKSGAGIAWCTQLRGAGPSRLEHYLDALKGVALKSGAWISRDSQNRIRGESCHSPRQIIVEVEEV